MIGSLRPNDFRIVGPHNFVLMEASLLITFIGVTIPFGLTFNKWGVAQKGLRYTFKFQKLFVIFDVCAFNGLWGGSMTVRATLWGCGGVLSKSSLKFSSFEECVEYLWKDALKFITQNGEDIPLEIQHFKRAMGVWIDSSFEDKFKAFEEIFYDT